MHATTTGDLIGTTLRFAELDEAVQGYGVYSPEAELQQRIVELSPPRSWVHTSGDHVWEIGPDPATEEYVVRKVRLVEPFE